MKKITALIIASVMLFASTGVFAEQIVTVTLDGNPIEFDVPAQVIDDRTMVPVRRIFEALGADVQWDEETEIIAATKNSILIILKAGSKVMPVADVLSGENKKILLDVPPMMVGDRTLVPVRAISESLGINVEWVEETQTVVLTSK